MQYSSRFRRVLFNSLCSAAVIAASSLSHASSPANTYTSATDFLKSDLGSDTSVVFVADVEGSVPEVKMRSKLLSAFRDVDPNFNCVFIEFPARMDAGMASYLAGDGTIPSFDETFVFDLKHWLNLNGVVNPTLNPGELVFQTLLDGARSEQMKVFGADNPPELWGSDPNSISEFAKVSAQLEYNVGKVFSNHPNVSPQDHYYGEEALIGWRDLGFFLNMSRDIPANQCKRSIAFLGNAHLIGVDGGAPLGPQSPSNRMLPVTVLMQQAGYKIQTFADSTLDCGDPQMPTNLQKLRADGCAQSSKTAPGTVLARAKQPGDTHYFPDFGNVTMDILEGFFLY